MLVSFEGDEEELVNSVISVLDSGREKFLFQEIQLQSKIRHKGIAIDLKRREVVRDNRKIELTYTEFEILQLLAQNPGRVFSKEQIYDVVWKEPYSGDYNIYQKNSYDNREFSVTIRYKLNTAKSKYKGTGAGESQKNRM